jgi:4-amino-4-deoxy-L-arabinose transferase-like glycosyltransferase
MMRFRRSGPAHSYLRGDLLVNLEHPMLLKSLVTLSLGAADVWNRGLGISHQISDEVAVRLPNVIFGSLTAVVIFLLAQEFFGFEVALISAFLWAVGTIAITVNRLAKEDTLLVFFTWLAYYLYLKAKKLGPTPTRTQRAFYAASGASFGLMLASKYFPHYLGLNFLYYFLVRHKQQFPPRRRVDTLLVFGTCTLVFLLANPVILQPSTLRHMFHYVQEETITHHGYLMMGQFYSEGLAFAGSMPLYFYPLFLGIKTPLPILAALSVGLVEVWRRREAGPFFLIFMFLFWIVPFSLVGGKWMRYMLSWDAHCLHHCCDRDGTDFRLTFGLVAAKNESSLDTCRE